MKTSHEFRNLIVRVVVIASLLISSSVFAQDSGTTGLTGEVKISISDDDAESNITGKDITRWSILGGTAPAVLLFGLKTWDWGGRHQPFSRKEGWFGEDTAFGGADKAGHGLIHYDVQRAMYNVFNWTENGGDLKWAYSIGTAVTVGTLIEVGDSYTSTYGFSYEDLVADYTGIMIGALLDYSPMLDGFFGFSFQYLPSDGYRAGYEKSELLKYSLDIVNDYSGNQYMMNFKIAGFRNLGFDVPFILRILSIDLGWYTKGYTHYDVGQYAKEKERNIFVGISINSAQLLSEFWPQKHRNMAYTASHTFLEYYHLPYDELPVPTRYVNNLNK